MSSTASESSLVNLPKLPVPRTRTSKGKSRSGCMICKQRKVKCDEARPNCSGCVKRSHKCIYKVPVTPKWKQSVSTFVVASRTQSNENSPIGSGLESTKSSSYFGRSRSPTLPNYYLSSIPAEDRHSFGIEDCLLLKHFKSFSSAGLIGNQELWAGDILQLAFEHSFLLHAILAVTTRHFQIACHDQAVKLSCDFKQLEEKHYQRTVSGLNCALEKDPRGDRDALLATSFLMCFYACSIQDFKPSTLAQSDDTSFIFLLGTRSLVMEKRHLGPSSIMGSLTERPKWLSLFLPRISPLFGPGGRLINLTNRLPVGSPFLTNKAIYIERIESLTVYFSTTSANFQDHDSVEGLSLCFLRWQTTCPSEFMSLVRSYDPIALIILAHYYAAAGSVHKKADNVFWWWQKPRYMVETIAEFLLPDWSEWLEWPLETIGKF